MRDGNWSPRFSEQASSPMSLLLQLWADGSVRAAVGDGSDLYARVQACIDDAFDAPPEEKA